MRTVTFSALCLAFGLCAAPSGAQRIEHSARPMRSAPTLSAPAGGWLAPHPARPTGWNRAPRPGEQRPSRWGRKIGGHWYAGHQAPGGWNGNRRATRGWIVPHYWIAPSFYIGDYASYGLSTPPYGYNWSRYYDDAVLLDQRGQVWGSVSGLDWDRDDGYRDNGDGDGDDGGEYAEGPGAGYPPPRVVYGAPAEVVQGGGYSGSHQQSGYISGGYWYPPVTTTTVTVSQAPVIVTTTTDYIDTVSYAAPRRTDWKRKAWRPRTKIRQCGCACRC